MIAFVLIILDARFVRVCVRSFEVPFIEAIKPNDLTTAFCFLAFILATFFKNSLLKKLF
ncbi:MAG: hypothetical protein ACI9DJ_000952 [Algoriphagus sp.]|jgi:hypothetical protein